MNPSTNVLNLQQIHTGRYIYDESPLYPRNNTIQYYDPFAVYVWTL